MEVSLLAEQSLLGFIRFWTLKEVNEINMQQIRLVRRSLLDEQINSTCNECSAFHYDYLLSVVPTV